MSKEMDRIRELIAMGKKEEVVAAEPIDMSPDGFFMRTRAEVVAELVIQNAIHRTFPTHPDHVPAEYSDVETDVDGKMMTIHNVPSFASKFKTRDYQYEVMKDGSIRCVVVPNVKITSDKIKIFEPKPIVSIRAGKILTHMVAGRIVEFPKKAEPVYMGMLNAIVLGAKPSKKGSSKKKRKTRKKSK